MTDVNDNEVATSGATPVVSEGELPQRARDEADAMLQDPNLVDRIIEDLAALGVAGERELVLALYLVGTSRLLTRPLAAIVQGPSSSGKSYLIARVAELFPDETMLRATDITPQALYYMDPGSLAHKFVVAGERSHRKAEEAANATKALREMISEGRLDKHVTTKVEGQWQTEHIHQDGPIAFVESTTQSEIFEEDLNRCLVLNTDERVEQTERILEQMAAKHGPEAPSLENEHIVNRHHALQGKIEKRVVVIPFSARLSKLFPKERVEARRTFGHVLSVIQALALLHQQQRETDDRGRIVAERRDYELARRLLHGPLERILGSRVSSSATRFYQRLVAKPRRSFSTRQAREGENVTDRTIRNWLDDLHSAGLVEIVTESRGREPAWWALTDAGLDDLAFSGLPSLDDLFPQSDFRHSDKAQVPDDKELTPEDVQDAGNSDKRSPEVSGKPAGSSESPLSTNT